MPTPAELQLASDTPPSGAGSARQLIVTIRDHSLLLFTLLGLMWAVEVVDLLPFLHLNHFGIHPRSVAGLWGIVFAPFLHAGFGHLLANSLPFIVLGGLVLVGGRRLFWSVSIFVVLAGGFGVWLLAGRFSNHIGASGLIFGYLGFLLARGYFARSVAWMLAAFAILVVYGGLLFGVLPVHTGISWQAHLFGFLAGIGAARLMFPRRAERLE